MQIPGKTLSVVDAPAQWAQRFQQSDIKKREVPAQAVLKLVQLASVHRHKMQFNEVDIPTGERFLQALRRGGDPFAHAASKTMLIRTPSPQLISRLEREAAFFSQHVAPLALPSGILSQYLAQDELLVERVIALAALASNPDFGVPVAKKADQDGTTAVLVLVERDLVDWLCEHLKLANRAQGLRIARDMVECGVVVPWAEKGQKRRSSISGYKFTDGDSFLVWDFALLRGFSQMFSLLDSRSRKGSE